MKKFLSLVLALVMTMSLVTVSAGAKDFTDDSEITYKEAVDVISALGVVDGYSDGDFRPDDVLTRGAAAKIICNLILGPTTASALSAGTAPFKDVPVTNTFAGYITYCSQQGIISGYADGTFRPTGTLSGNAFMKMLLGALGYDSSIEGYTGANWQVSVIKQASGIGLDDGNDEFVGSQAVTRQEAALYAFNMLQATMVEYDKKDTIVVGDITITGDVEYKDITSSADYAKAMADKVLDDGKYAVQLGEKLFDGSLKIDTAVTSDAFARPARTWNYKGEQVVVAADEADYVLNGEVTGKELFNTVGETLADSNKYTWTINLDGTTGSTFSQSNVTKSNDNALLGTGNGTVMEIFVTKEYVSSSEKGYVVVSIVNTYAGQISSVMGQDDVDEDEGSPM